MITFCFGGICTILYVESISCLGRVDLQLSLLVPEPDMVIAQWDIQNAVEAYIKPFLEKFPLQVT